MLWPAIEDVCGELFSDTSGVSDRESFIAWFENWVPRCVIAVTQSGECVSCAYVTDLEPMKKAVFHAFTAKRHRQPEATKLLALKAIDHLIDNYQLQRLEALGRNDNRVARITAASLGFRGEGVLPQHKRHNGEWNDYFLKSITR